MEMWFRNDNYGIQWLDFFGKSGKMLFHNGGLSPIRLTQADDAAYVKHLTKQMFKDAEGKTIQKASA